MLPVVLGVFFAHSTRPTGTTSSEKQEPLVTHWFIARNSGGEYITQPLNDRGMPSGFIKTISENEFLQKFIPDTEEKHRKIRAGCLKLRLTLESTSDTSKTPSLTPDEAMIRDGLLAILHGRVKDKPDQEDFHTIKNMLSEMGDMQGLAIEYQRILANAAIVLRKDGNHAEAIKLYKKALMVDGQNDHILFNLARVYFETDKLTEAKESLYQALERNPDLDMARRFLRFLDASRENSHDRTP